MDFPPNSVAIIGAGISGISIARLLSEKGFSLQVFEQEDHSGGLVHCSIEEGSLYHRVGGHVFNSKNPQVLEWFWRHFDRDREFVKAKRCASIYLDDNHVPYPIELNIRHFKPDIARKIINELISLARRPQDLTDFPSFADFLLGNFGETLSSLYFFPYNQKVWKQDLNEISVDWLEGKLPMISPSKIIEANILSSSDSMVHSEFYYPIQGGSQFIVNRLSDGIPIHHEQVQAIDLDSDKYIINHDHGSGCDHLVYTGDLRLLPDILSQSILLSACITNDEIAAIRRLRSHGTTTLLCECDANPYSWIYLPDATTKLHRMIMTGNFSATNNNQSLPLGRITCTVEYSGWMSELDMKRELSMLPFHPAPIAYHHCASSYVIHDHHTTDLVSGFVDKLRSVSVYCCGRFSEWQYYNMDAAVASAMKVAQLIIEAS